MMTSASYCWIKCEWRSFRFDLGAAIFWSLKRFSLIFPSHKSIKLSDWFSGLGSRWWKLSKTPASFVSVASTFCSRACGPTPTVDACAAMLAGHWSVGRRSTAVVFLRELVWSPSRHALTIGMGPNTTWLLGFFWVKYCIVHVYLAVWGCQRIPLEVLATGNSAGGVSAWDCGSTLLRMLHFFDLGEIPRLGTFLNPENDSLPSNHSSWHWDLQRYPLTARECGDGGLSLCISPPGGWAAQPSRKRYTVHKMRPKQAGLTGT